MKIIKKHFIFFVLATLIFSAETKAARQNYTLHVLKLGGGLITEKSGAHGVAKHKNIVNSAQQIAHFLSKNPNHRIILVHGGGSFAHPIAKKYKLHLGLNQNNASGVIETHNGMKDLNKIFVQELNNLGVNALPIHPMSCIRCSGGKMVNLDTTIIQNMLENHFVPVLHGDIVMDDTTGVSVLSGDLIAANLGNKLHAYRVGYASIEDGVYDDDGKIIPEISEHNFDDVKKFIGGSKHTDVTGGMLGKVEALLGENAPQVSCIFNGTHKCNIGTFLEGKVLGTTITNAHAKQEKNMQKPQP